MPPLPRICRANIRYPMVRDDVMKLVAKVGQHRVRNRDSRREVFSRKKVYFTSRSYLLQFAVWLIHRSLCEYVKFTLHIAKVRSSLILAARTEIKTSQVCLTYFFYIRKQERGKEGKRKRGRI